ncbi:MAG: amino acid transporter, partial [Thermoanaerobaculia bacterium]
TETPIADAAAAIVGGLGAIVVTIGALLSMAGTNSGTVFEGSRMLYAIFEERRWKFISYIHPRYRTPTVAIVIHVLVAMVLSLAGGFATMAKLSAVARLATYLFTCAALPRLRRVGAGWQLPGGWLIPGLGVAVSLLIVVTLDAGRLIAAAIAVAVGAILFAASRPSGAPLAPSVEHD